MSRKNIRKSLEVCQEVSYNDHIGSFADSLGCIGAGSQCMASDLKF